MWDPPSPPGATFPMEHPAYDSCAIDLGHSVIVTGGYDGSALANIDRCPSPLTPTVHQYLLGLNGDFH